MNRPAKLVSLSLTLFLCSGISLHAACLPIVTVTPVIGPNIGSPSFDDFRVNFMNFLAFGTPGPDYNLDPTGFLNPVPTPVDASEIIASSFNSWRGQGDPTPGWDGPSGQFADELGNRIYFGLSVESPADCISGAAVNQITGSLEWQDANGDPAAALISPTPVNFDFSGEDYDEFRWGVAGTTVFNENFPAPGGTVVEDIYYLGGSTAITSFTFDDSGLVSDQDNLSKTIDRINDEVAAGNLLQAHISYELTTVLGKTVEGEGTVVLPEPASGLLICVALGFLAGTRRFRSL